MKRVKPIPRSFPVSFVSRLSFSLALDARALSKEWPGRATTVMSARRTAIKKRAPRFSRREYPLRSEEVLKRTQNERRAKRVVHHVRLTPASADRTFAWRLRRGAWGLLTLTTLNRAPYHLRARREYLVNIVGYFADVGDSLLTKRSAVAMCESTCRTFKNAGFEHPDSVSMCAPRFEGGRGH